MASTPLKSMLDNLKEWTSIEQFQRTLSEYFSSNRSAEDIGHFRLGRGAFKRLRDEVVPVLHFFSSTGLTGEVRFQFSNSSPDCWYRRADDTSPRAMEITRAQARGQFYIARELNANGASFGYIGLRDSAPNKDFEKALREPRMATTEAVLEYTASAILERLRKKAEKAYGDIELLIEAQIGEDQLPPETWNRILPMLRQEAETTGFRHVHLIGALAPECNYFQLK